MAAMGGGRDAELLSAAEILVSLRSRKLRAWPEWVRPTPSRPAGEASPSAGPAQVPDKWPTTKPRSKPPRLRAESASTSSSASRELEQQGGAGASAAAAGSAGSDQAAARGHAGDKESMDASSPVTPLEVDNGAGGSGASSSADDAARPPAKRKGAGARGSAAAPSVAAGDDEGCSSPAKRGRVAEEEEKPANAISAVPEPCMQAEARSGKGAPLLFDLNESPPLEDYDDVGLHAS